jgi:hypothetical protein
LILFAITGDARQRSTLVFTDLYASIGGRHHDLVHDPAPFVEVRDMQALGLQLVILQGFQHRLASIDGQQLKLVMRCVGLR